MALSPRALLSPLTDSRSVAFGVVSTAALSALSLVEPRHLTPGGRLAYRAALAGATAWTAWSTMRPSADLPISRDMRAAVAVGSAGLTLGIAEASEALDGRITDSMRRRGVRQPRVVLAIASAALSGLSWWLDRRMATDETIDTFTEDDIVADAEVELPEEVRALAAHLLAATEQFGAPELREQLASARAHLFEGPDGPGGFWPGVGLVIDPELPRAVPANATFPVVGRYRALGDRTFDVYLQITDGRLSVVSVGEGSDWSDDDQLAWFEGDRGVHELAEWPTPDKLELLIESSSGLVPLASA